MLPYIRTSEPSDASLATCSPLALLNGSVPSQVQSSAVPLVELSPPALDLSMLVAVSQPQNKTRRETDMPEKQFFGRFLFVQVILPGGLFFFFLAVSYCGYTNACIDVTQEWNCECWKRGRGME